MSPRNPRSDFFKIMAVCFVLVVVVHQWNLVEYANKAARGNNVKNHHKKVNTRPPKIYHVPNATIAPADLDEYNPNFRQGVAKEYTEETEVNITRRKFMASENGSVFILGVVAKNSTADASWDTYAVYGEWYHHKQVNESTIRCCFKYADGRVVERPYSEFIVQNYRRGMLRAKLMLWHITCHSPHRQPDHVSIARHFPCDSEYITYFNPYFAMKKPDGHLVITTKLAYKHMDAEYVIGFLEAAMYLGIDKVITYVVDNLEPHVKKILRYYHYIGIMDYYEIELANHDEVFRRFPPLFNAQYRCDEWIVKRDALERNIGSTYFGIFDMDEYLIPTNNRNLKQLFADLLVSYSNASHFFFPNVHYLTDSVFPDPVCHPNCSVYRRHIMASPDLYNDIHEKMLLLTNRVITSTISNHRVYSLPGYERATCPHTEAYIRHYGSCHRKFPGTICGNRTSWVKDTTMIPWAEEHIYNMVVKTRQFLKV